MRNVILNSGLDTLLFAIPLLGTLFLGFFRLDELISATEQEVASRPKLTGRGSNGEHLFSDPDGRPWVPQTRSGQ